MLTLPDFTEKKIVVVANFGDDPNDLKIKNSNICLYKFGEFKNEITPHLVLCIFIIGSTTLTTNLIEKTKKLGISIFLLNRSLKLIGYINSKAEGNYKIRTIQYNLSKSASLELSKNLVYNKVLNQLSIVGQKNKASDFKKQIFKTKSEKTLLGIEGNISSLYFKEVFKNLNWYRRAPQTKEDIPNLLLDIGYTFLFNYVDSLLNLFGFDTYKGFYHKLFFQRKSLSCDLMEPMRPLIDKQLVKSFNLGQINKKDFKFKNGSFTIKNGNQKKYVDIWLRVLMKHRDLIYSYVLGFYRHLLYPEKYKFPMFKV